MSKLLKQLKIALALAKIQGYDSDGRVLGSNGYVENSSVLRLLNHAMYPEKLLVDEKEFIILLKKANIDPELILNDNVKRKLTHTQYEEPKIERKPFVTEKIEVEPRAVKRRFEETESIEGENPKKSRLDDDDDW